MPNTKTINQESVDKKIDEITDNLKKKAKECREYLEKFIETDSDDFSGMHTTRGIPDDGFYGVFYAIEKEADEAREQIQKLLVEAVKKEKLLRLAAELRESELRDKVAAVENLIDAFGLTKST